MVLRMLLQTVKPARKTTFHFTMTYITFDEWSIFLEYYKKETMLNNPIARQEMVLPDIKPLPTLVLSNNKK